MNAPILTAKGNRRYVIDAGGNLIITRLHTPLKPGQHLATQAEVDAKSTPPADPVTVPPVVTVSIGGDFAGKSPRERSKAAKAPAATAEVDPD
jgi:hypothetical protein